MMSANREYALMKARFSVRPWKLIFFYILSAVGFAVVMWLAFFVEGGWKYSLFIIVSGIFSDMFLKMFDGKRKN